jgi:uncharacterized protein YuzE
MTFDYADHADVLYVTFVETKNKCIYVEIDAGVICRIDETKNLVVGITIVDFFRRATNGDPVKIPALRDGLSADQLLQFYAGEK